MHLLISAPGPSWCGRSDVSGRTVFAEGFVGPRLSKAYPGVTALQDVSFSLAPGEIRALCGENGAGKSTLRQDFHGHRSAGQRLDRHQRQVQIDARARSRRKSLASDWWRKNSASRRICRSSTTSGSAAPRCRSFIGARNFARAREQALAKLGLGDWDLDRPVSSLTIGQRQLVEIARLLARDVRVLILDEPTATLSDAEIERILGILEGLRAQGRSIIYITHRLGEVFELCDSVTVLRNGQHVATQPVSEVTREHLVELMLGRSVRGHVSEGGGAGGPGCARGRSKACTSPARCTISPWSRRVAGSSASPGRSARARTW